MYRITLAGATEIGAGREENQDAFIVDGAVFTNSGARFFIQKEPDGILTAAVIDGMGGYAGGRAASGLTALKLAEIQQELSEQEWQKACCDLSALIRGAGEAWGSPKMGAVFAALSFKSDGVYAINIGDCRAYRAFGDYFVQMSIDDKNAMDGLLTQALCGMFPRPSPHFRFFPYGERNERFLICSDGLVGALGDEGLKAQIFSADTLDVILGRMVELAYAQQPQDNFTFVVAEVEAEGG